MVLITDKISLFQGATPLPVKFKGGCIAPGPGVSSLQPHPSDQPLPETCDERALDFRNILMSGETSLNNVCGLLVIIDGIKSQFKRAKLGVNKDTFETTEGDYLPCSVMPPMAVKSILLFDKYHIKCLLFTVSFGNKYF